MNIVYAAHNRQFAVTAANGSQSAGIIYLALIAILELTEHGIPLQQQAQPLCAMLFDNP